MYYYESHLGGVYTSENDLDYEDLYCEECGDSDTPLGYFETPEEFLANFADEISYCGSGGYDLNTLLEDIMADIKLETAENIVKKNRQGTKVDLHEFLDFFTGDVCPDDCDECPFHYNYGGCKLEDALFKCVEVEND